MVNETVFVALIGLAGLVVAIVVPLTTVILTFISARSTSHAVQVTADQSKALLAANANNAALIAQVAELVAINKQLVKDKDGMPLVIAQGDANNLLHTNYILVQRAALTEAGVPPEKQPPEPPQLPVSPLTPPDLLRQIKDGGHVTDTPAQNDDAQHIEVSAPMSIEVVAKPDTSHPPDSSQQKE